MASDKLYTLAATYEKLSLFRELSEQQIFGVRLPSGEIAYCSVLGKAARGFGLSVYVGEENLDRYRHTFFQSEYNSENEDFFRFISQKYFQCLLTTKDELSDDELQAEKSFSKRNKIYFRARHSHPRFLKFSPMYEQSFIEDEADEKILELALTAAIEVGNKYLDDDLPRKIEFINAPPIRRKFPLLTPDGENFIWTMEKFPPLRYIQYPVPKFSADVLKKFKRQKKVADYQCELFAIPCSMPEVGSKRLKFPVMFMLMDSKAKMLDKACAPNFNYLERTEELLNPLISLCTKKGVPEKIFVREDRTYDFLEDFCEQVGIELVEVEDIQEMDEAEDELVEIFDEETEGKSTEDYINELIKMLDSVPAKIFRETMPPEVKLVLESLLNENIFDAQTNEKIREILK